MSRAPLHLAAALGLLAIPGIAASARHTAPVSPALEQAAGPASRGDLQRDALDAFRARDYARAQSLLVQQIARDPTNFVPQYNLACAQAMAGAHAAAEASLKRAIEKGFTDLRQLHDDPSLEPIRDRPGVRELIDKWDVIRRARGEANMEALRERYGRVHYRYQSDESLMLNVACGYKGEALEDARAELALLTRFALEEVFHDLREPSPVDAWVDVVLPTRHDFRLWAFRTYGPAAKQNFSAIGGSYNHDRKQLVTQDLGSTLRHEFFHVLHWRSTTRAGQNHPIWIQEGLCSLVEDYDLIGEGERAQLVPTGNYRTNTARNLARGGSLLPIEDLAVMDRARFTNQRPMANYAQARAFFRFLHAEGRLAAWYARYVMDYRSDPTGIESLGAIYDEPMGVINARYRAWLRAQPEVPESIDAGMASLGVEVDHGEGEGPVVLRSIGRQPGPDRLRLGGVITHLDGLPTRDLPELIRRLGGYRPGDEVVVRVRTGKRVQEARVRLVVKR